MQRLDIPLTPYTHTTRRPRRVVWLLGAAVALALAAWIGGASFAARDTLSAHAPAGTEEVLRLLVNGRTAGDIGSLMRHVPLISGRSLSVEDILPYTRGEFAVAFLADGSRALLLRANPADVPRADWEQRGILWREVAPGTYLLSSQEVSGETAGFKGGWSLRLPFSRTIGAVRFLQDGAEGSGAIRVISPGHVAVDVPLRLDAHLPDALPSVKAALALPIPGHFLPTLAAHALDAPLTALQAPLPADLIDLFAATRGMLLIPDANEARFFLSIDANDGVFAQLEAMMRAAAALAVPETERFVLPDGTVATELVADPGRITVEETVVAGVPVNRVALEDGDAFLLAERDGQIAFTNHEPTFRFWAEGASEETVARPCTGNGGWIDAGWLTRQQAGNASSFLAPDFTQILRNISFLSLEHTGKYTRIHLCQ